MKYYYVSFVFTKRGLGKKFNAAVHKDENYLCPTQLANEIKTALCVDAVTIISWQEINEEAYNTFSANTRGQ